MNGVEVVVKVGPLAAMPRIAGQADSRATVSPMTGPPDVGATPLPGRVGPRRSAASGARTLSHVAVQTYAGWLAVYVAATVGRH